MSLPWKPLIDVGRVDAVDEEQVLRRGRPIDRDRERPSLGLAEVRLDARLREHDVRVVAADRQLVDDLRRVVASLRRRGRVDERRLTRDGHLGRRRERQRQVDGGRRVEGDRRLLLDLAEAREVRGDGVRARRNRRESITTVRGGDRGANALEIRARDLHGHSRQGIAALVGHGSLDRAGGLAEGGGGCKEKDRRDDQVGSRHRSSLPPGADASFLLDRLGTPSPRGMLTARTQNLSNRIPLFGREASSCRKSGQHAGL